ncbi:MAG: flagellar hook-basal body complex protein FliE [Anaeromyxobacteraceae bacterium]
MAPIVIPPAVRDLAILDPAKPGVGTVEGPAAGGSFADALGQALQSVEKLQLDADKSAEAVAMGGGNLHETALALEKADVALRVATKVRNKLVDAYQEIMRMSV